MPSGGQIAGGALSGALPGAAIGTAVMPGIGTAVGAGVGALVGGFASLLGGSDDTSEALERAGAAQIAAAERAMALQLQERQASLKLAALSPDEIKTINAIFSTRDTALSQSLQSIQKQQMALDQIDPAVRASGKSYYDLVTGKAAAILEPLGKNLKMQRQSIIDNLASTMGPGYATSSAGIEALTRFDNQASMTLNTAQMQAVTTIGNQYQGLSSLQQQGQSGITSNTLAAYTQAQNANTAALQGYEVAKLREIGAMGANPINAFGAVSTAGANFAGQAYAGQAASQIQGQLLGAGLNLGGTMIGANYANSLRQGNLGASGSPGLGSAAGQETIYGATNTFAPVVTN